MANYITRLLRLFTICKQIRVLYHVLLVAILTNNGKHININH